MTAAAMKPGEERFFQYHRHGKPVPQGWQFAATLGHPHGWFAVLIMQAMSKDAQDEKLLTGSKI
jgi:hypothetical protein